MDRPPTEDGSRALAQGRRLRSIQLLSLLFTSGTLVCCVLPATLVLIGAGSVMASLVSTVPALVVLSQHKALVFTLAGVGLLLAGLALWRPRMAWRWALRGVGLWRTWRSVRRLLGGRAGGFAAVTPARASSGRAPAP